MDGNVKQTAVASRFVEAFIGKTTARYDTATLRSEIATLRCEVERLTEERDRLVLVGDLMDDAAQEQANSSKTDNVYVLDEDTDEARAFDEFYSAYDEAHAKTRKFLLG